jgi:hypothetical protein
MEQRKAPLYEPCEYVWLQLGLVVLLQYKQKLQHLVYTFPSSSPLLESKLLALTTHHMGFSV